MGLAGYGDIAYGWAMEDTTGLARCSPTPAQGVSSAPT